MASCCQLFGGRRLRARCRRSKRAACSRSGRLRGVILGRGRGPPVLLAMPVMVSPASYPPASGNAGRRESERRPGPPIADGEHCFLKVRDRKRRREQTDAPFFPVLSGGNRHVGARANGAGRAGSPPPESPTILRLTSLATRPSTATRPIWERRWRDRGGDFQGDRGAGRRQGSHVTRRVEPTRIEPVTCRLQRSRFSAASSTPGPPRGLPKRFHGRPRRPRQPARNGPAEPSPAPDSNRRPLPYHGGHASFGLSPNCLESAQNPLQIGRLL